MSENLYAEKLEHFKENEQPEAVLRSIIDAPWRDSLVSIREARLWRDLIREA